LKVAWLDAEFDTSSFHLVCKTNKKVHKWTKRCENYGHNLWTDVISRAAVLVVDVQLGKKGVITPECLHLIREAQSKISNKRIKVS
jgi:hypothetical protein